MTAFDKMRGQIESKKLKNWNLQQKTLQDFKAQGMTVEKATKRTIEKLGIMDGLLMENKPKEYKVKFQFQSADDDQPCISVLDVHFRYNLHSPILFSNLRFTISSTSRIAIVGPNGIKNTDMFIYVYIGKHVDGINDHVIYYRCGKINIIKFINQSLLQNK
jgi:ATPase subunit of ABC transporter with duplicated ATPase domains